MFLLLVFRVLQQSLYTTSLSRDPLIDGPQLCFYAFNRICMLNLLLLLLLFAALERHGELQHQQGYLRSHYHQMEDVDGQAPAATTKHGALGV